MTTCRSRSSTRRSGFRERVGEALVLRATRLGAVGALAALLGTVVALGLADVGHPASGMAVPTLVGAGLMVSLTAAGLLIAPPPARARLRPWALRWLAAAALLCAWGMWLGAQR